MEVVSLEDKEDDDFILDLELDFDIDDFDISIDTEENDETRIIKPKFHKTTSEKHLCFKNAKDLAKKVKNIKNERMFCVVNGSFIFGDFIEAFIYDNNITAKELTVSTLSMNQNNIDSLLGLLKLGYIEKLNLIISAYFYSHEKNGLIKYIYENLDVDNKFQLSVARTHCKLCIFETEDDKKWVIHGSDNLRSSGNIEQFMIEENEELYDFNMEYQRRIIDTYATIKKEVGGVKLWQVVAQEKAEEKA